MTTRQRPGAVRDGIIAVLRRRGSAMTIAELRDAVSEDIGSDVPASSVRSYLNLNTPGRFIRTGRGRYKLSTKA